jgi:hypothetical protein
VRKQKPSYINKESGESIRHTQSHPGLIHPLMWMVEEGPQVALGTQTWPSVALQGLILAPLRTG